MFCNHCGASNADGSRFCTDCGGAITSSTPGKKPAPITAETEYGLPIGAVLANRYRILGALGMGGMGRVYLAEDQKLETRVAIKVLREILSRDPGSVKRLIEEAKHSMTLAHPNVVRVHNFEDGELVKFLIMEYVEGETLAKRIADRGKLPEAEARRIAIGICLGLEHAHEQKVIHRDIKPGNILLGKSGAIKIADFGIARECRDSVSRLTSQVDSGTLLYMSPEQLVGKSNEASDVYSLGIVLYEMLAGEPPFRTGDITYQIREIVPDPPAGVAPELGAIVLKCLEKKPERRFPSVRALREELDGTAEAKRKDEARTADLRRAEKERLRAEEQRKAEEARRRAEEQREDEERRRQAELEANRRRGEERRAAEERKEQERRKQAEIEANKRKEEERFREEERKKTAGGLAAAALALLDQGAYDEADTKLREAFSLDPANAEAHTALDRCRAERTASEERRQRAQSQKTTPAVAKPNYGRRAAIGLLAVGIIIVMGISLTPVRNADIFPAWKTPSPAGRYRWSGTLQFHYLQHIGGTGVKGIPIIIVIIWIVSSLGNKGQISSAVAEMEFVSIPAGKFTMGCSAGDSQCSGDENPRHEVMISRSFELGKFEVTQGQWVKVMGSNPSRFTGDDRLPVENVSWNDAQAFIAKLNALNDGYRYRLPTEAEWEYAARGGTAGSQDGNLDAIAWYDSNSGSKTHPVGQKQANGYDLYDMLGNVWEWCSDWYGENYYGSSPTADSKGPSSGQYRVLRGGSWSYGSWVARVSLRYWSYPVIRSFSIGFRVCREKL